MNQNGELEQWLNWNKNNIYISLNDSNNIEFSETEKKAHTPSFGEKVTKIAKHAFQNGGHLVSRHLKT